LPDSWRDVAFHNFRAEGAFLISARRENGKTSFVRIKSLAGEPCVISPAMEGIPLITGTNEIKPVEMGKGCYRLDMSQGEEVILYPGDRKPDFIMEPLASDPKSINHFGIR
jgi:hypothetical protein